MEEPPQPVFSGSDASASRCSRYPAPRPILEPGWPTAPIREGMYHPLLRAKRGRRRARGSPRVLRSGLCPFFHSPRQERPAFAPNRVPGRTRSSALSDFASGRHGYSPWEASQHPGRGERCPLGQTRPHRICNRDRSRLRRKGASSLARFKRGDRVVVTPREVTAADRKSGLYYAHFAGLHGTVDQV